jgi:hypothetical protein
MKRLLCLFALLTLTSCADVSHLHSKYLFGLDCRPEKLQNGQCVATR